MNFIYILAAFLLAVHGAQASELASGQKSLSTNSSVSLPHCIDGAKEIQKIKNTVNANRKSQHKYKGYREVFRHESDEEILARLAYAETVAANCPSLNNKLGPKIVTAIGNRVERRNGDVRSVVFERDQFSSSLNFYSGSNTKDFLCPQDKKLWSQVLAASQARLSQKSVNQNSAINYFLYKHHPQWTKAPWKLAEDKELTTSDVRECIRFFSVPGWR